MSNKYFSAVNSAAAFVLWPHYEVTQEENSLCDNMKTHICQKDKWVCIENPSVVVGVKWLRPIWPWYLLFKQENIEKISVSITRHCIVHLNVFFLCLLQVILYPTSNSSKSAELHRMIVPKNSQDSDLKIKLAVRMDKPPHMKHSGWVCTWRSFSSELVDLISMFHFCQFTDRVSISWNFPPKWHLWDNLIF